jgi:prephenate dehydratase
MIRQSRLSTPNTALRRTPASEPPSPGSLRTFVDTNPGALKELLAEITNRSITLSDFHIGFLWDPD